MARTESAILKLLSAKANPLASQTAEGSLQFKNAQEVDRTKGPPHGTFGSRSGTPGLEVGLQGRELWKEIVGVTTRFTVTEQIVKNLL